MHKLSEHFSRHEFACKCGCGFDTVDVELLIVAELIREHIGAYTPNSACRCISHNKNVDGSRKSMHLFARAIDVPADNPIELYNFLDKEFPDTYGIGLYSTFVHIDTREKKARWIK